MSHPLRLAIVRQKYRPDGGAERFIARALDALSTDELELNVITREWQGHVDPDWHIHLCNPKKYGRISRESGFAKAARACWQENQFDIVQSHERIAGCDIFRAGDGVHRRWLLQRQRILPRWKGHWLFYDRYHRYVMNAEKQMYADPALKQVICNSHMVKQEIIEDFGLSADKISVIYNAIDHNAFIPATDAQKAALKTQYDIPQGSPCFIYVGSGFERKGLAAAISAIASTSAILLVVGADKNQKKYEDLANQLGCRQRVFFLGMQKETLSLYQMADALLLPTLYDPFPNVILEALSCGLPVITSTRCGGAEFIENGKNGFVCDALDISALTDAIIIISKKTTWYEMSAAARETILPYTPQHLSDELISLYKRILAL
ncbi:glycosyltransferase family 4 protein [Proteus hauseri]|uniref:glycosyltransferase family 4 protein n=1 Tax=Proteus hauseri TaxID=183417 RepID=UPI001009836E|nr:glycosyltransferase family 4 protein [Proteus hauseri]QAV23153.1 glycosyl transferase family 1 [Proteus hauseri]